MLLALPVTCTSFACSCSIVTATDAEVVVPPPVRFITDCRLAVPAATPAVFQEQEYGALVSVQMVLQVELPLGLYCSCIDTMPVLE